jgi:uncharacterized membrane protein YbhN (UPF0104 family)
MSNTSLRNWLLVAVKLAVTVGLFTLIAQKVDLSDVARRLAEASYPLLVLATSLFVAQLALNAERWRRLLALDDAHLSWRRGFRYYVEASFFNQALPGAVGGDVLRVYRARAHCSSLTQAVNSVLLDRLTGLLGLATLILIGLPLFLNRVGDTGPAGGVALLLGLAALGIASLILLARMDREGVGGKARALIVDLAKQVDRLARRPGVALTVLGLALCTHGMLVLAAFVSARALGYDFTLVECLIVVPSAMFLSLLPISLGGWGVREGAMAAGFALIGQSHAAGVALSVTLGLELLAVGLIGGLIWFLSGASVPEERALAAAEKGD